MKKIGLFKDYTDGSLKSVYEVDGKNIVEMTLLFNRNFKDVICVPTHHFCNLGCKMCHLTNEKVKRPMLKIKVKDFIECLVDTLILEGKRITDKKNQLISFMGVGEPLLNLELIEGVYEYEEYLKSVLGYESVGYAISTMMPNNNILELTRLVQKKNIPLKVHFSLHTPIDTLRFNLLPGTRVNINEALEYLKSYGNLLRDNRDIMEEYIKLHRTSDSVEIHYTLIEGVNDGEEELSRLCELLNTYKITIKFIRFNPINGMKPSSKEKMWVDTISSIVPDVRVKVYSPPGREIGSSCGEFTKHYYHSDMESEEEKLEFERWEQKHRVDVKRLIK